MAIQQLMVAQKVAAGGGTDPNFANVVFLAHFEGSNGATTFTDVKGKAITRGGNAVLSNTTAPFGTTALNLDGTGDFIRTTSNSTDFAFGTADFTVECFCYFPLTSTDYQTVIQPNSTKISGLLFMGSSDKFEWYDNDAADQCLSATISRDTWYHIAVSRNSGTTRLFVGGVVSGSTFADTQNYSATGQCRVGSPASSFNDMSGRAKDVRITKGVGRYTANFTPPTAAFPDS